MWHMLTPGCHNTCPIRHNRHGTPSCSKYATSSRTPLNYALSVKLNGNDKDVTTAFDDAALTDEKWYCYTDSDLAGNAEIQNKRRSQNGAVAVRAGAPMLWESKVTSVAFAHPLIDEAHADVSSASSEIYAASNATHSFLHLSYTIEEQGMSFPLPIKLHIDNTAAIAFANNSCFKSNLKHIDCRQEWVKVLRDKGIIEPVYVNTNENIADLFTKILGVRTFENLRDMIMVKHTVY